MALHYGPRYDEWLEVVNHSARYSAEDLKAFAQRIEQSQRLTQKQRVDLLQRLGELQIAAVNHKAALSA